MNNGAEKITAFDRQIMQRCLELAKRGEGKTSPNPMVGAVIVKDGQIVGEGFHPKAGQPHAEVFALREAGEKAQGATIYVSLEPCNHFGRTPPCSDAVIAAKVAKVVVGMVDPNPLVGGGGIEKIKNAGIEVIVGVEEEDCRKLNEGFIHRILYQKPFGILKYAMTLDGKIATTTGHSRWVTGRSARDYVHQLRATCDAVIVGGNTIRVDNPYLTTHKLADHNPLRVIMTRKLDLPLNCHVWNIKDAKTVVFTEKEHNLEVKKNLIDQGVEIIELNNLTPVKVMENLYNQGLAKVLWECGGNLAAKAIQAGAVQKIMAFIAPKIVGGKNALSPVSNLGIENMENALELSQVSFYALDSDFVIEGYLTIDHD
jgi:diaminohydroxyphosphoribosylaminopyrimidine deaminase/5-amino-6-(5-phosphoribosylamino)uracil reductase